VGKINFGRVIICGIVIGVVINIFEAVVNGWLLGAQWSGALVALGLPGLGVSQIVTFNVLALVVGVVTAWVYAAIRPRFGAGHLTAVYAGLVIWVLAYPLAYVTMAVMGLMPWSLMLIVSGTSLVEVIIATLVGCYFYKEQAA
jgi:hypothetical protein